MKKTMDSISAKRLLLERAAVLHDSRTPAAFARNLRGLCAEGAVLRAPHPLGDFSGVGAMAEGFWRPLNRAFPDLERRFDILLSARIARREWTCAMGHFVGTFDADYLGIPPTGGAVFLRHAEFRRLAADGRADEIVLFMDFPDLTRQAGVWPLPPALGAEVLFPSPATQDGVILRPPDPRESEKTSALAGAMLKGLSDYRGDLDSLQSMGQKRFWHPRMMWHGPAGIGTTRGLRGFEDFHQRPFLASFPDRRGAEKAACPAEGAYCVSFGWPAMTATHTGGGWLGLPPVRRKLTMRVADFWRREGDLLRENWVFIDIPDILSQMGLDLFARMRLSPGGREKAKRRGGR